MIQRTESWKKQIQGQRVYPPFIGKRLVHVSFISFQTCSECCLWVAYLLRNKVDVFKTGNNHHNCLVSLCRMLKQNIIYYIWAYRPWKIMSLSSGDQKVQNQGAGKFDNWWGPAFWFIGGTNPAHEGPISQRSHLLIPFEK